VDTIAWRLFLSSSFPVYVYVTSLIEPAETSTQNQRNTHALLLFMFALNDKPGTPLIFFFETVAVFLLEK
jgi:hypothetical protein